ncbi:MAG: 3',5'-cyclic-AMP phosphodiesterase [Pseudomonadales bacterium]|nr:3',5'-cyclic-AMP phosphodiesterase [Pseudomonadales bacterium]
MVKDKSHRRTTGQNIRPGVDGGPIRLIQVSDTHLFASPEGLMVGMKSDEGFQAVIESIRQQQKHIDIVVCTGDISQDASVSSYLRFDQTISSLGAPHLWIPGNHDALDNIRQAIGTDSCGLDKRQRLANWELLMLDTCVEGMIHGHLSEAELMFLDRHLEQQTQRADIPPVVICLHHNPLPVKARWLQKHALQNSEEFLAILDKYTHVKCVLWGHIHQEFDEVRKGVRMLASPSTCVQFHPENNLFALDDQNPGYRWLDLFPDGHLQTGVVRVSDRTFDIDFSSVGY